MFARNKRSLSPPKRSAKYSWFFKTGIVSLFYSIGFLISFFVMGETSEFIFSSFFQMLIPIPAFIGAQLSGGTYIGRSMDLILQKKSRFAWESMGTLIGMGVGLIAALVLISFRFGLQILAGNFYAILAAFSTTMATVASFGGLANRLTVPYQGYSPTESVLQHCINLIIKEKKAILLGTLTGLSLSMFLWFSGFAALTTVIGVTSFFTLGFALPLWFIGGLGVILYTSHTVAAFDYLGRAYTFFKAKYAHDQDAINTIHEKEYQFKGATLGSTLGIMTSAIIITALFLTQPYLTAALASAGVFFVCVNVLGGVCARICRLIDEKIAHDKDKEETSIKNPNQPFSNSKRIYEKLNIKEIELTNLHSEKKTFLSPKPHFQLWRKEKEEVKSQLYRTPSFS